MQLSVFECHKEPQVFCASHLGYRCSVRTVQSSFGFCFQHAIQSIRLLVSLVSLNEIPTLFFLLLLPYEITHVALFFAMHEIATLFHHETFNA